LLDDLVSHKGLCFLLFNIAGEAGTEEQTFFVIPTLHSRALANQVGKQRAGTISDGMSRAEYRLMRVACLTVIGASAAVLVGCVSAHYRISVNSLAARTSSPASLYAILPWTTNVGPDELQFREYADCLERAMSSLGYKRVNSLGDAELAVSLGYGIGEPKEYTYTYNSPLYGQTGVSSSTRSGTVSANAYRLGNSVYGSANYSETTAYTPSFGVIGYSKETANFTLYAKYLDIHADDLRSVGADGKVSPVWQTSVATAGSSSDLRKAVPVMIAGAMPYFGTNTGGTITLQVRENDRTVLFVKGLRGDQ
jgi:hypothetical protein